MLKNEPIDIVYDCVGKREDWPKAYAMIKKDGHFVTIQPGSLGKGLLANTYTKGKLLVVQDIHFHTLLTTASGKDLETIARLVDEGKIKPLVQEVVPVENVRHAVEQVSTGMFLSKQLSNYCISSDNLSTGHTRGKIAIEFVKN